VGVRLAQRLAPDVEGPAVDGLGLGVLALRVQVGGQVVVAGRRVGVPLAQRPAAEVEGPAVEGLGLGVFPLCSLVGGQVVVAGRRVGVRLPQRLAAEAEGLTQEGLGLGVLALRRQVAGHVVVACRRVGVPLAQHLAAQLEEAPFQGQRLGEPALPLQLPGLALSPFGRLKRLPPLRRQRHDLLQHIHDPPSVHRLPVVGPLEVAPQRQQLLRRLKRLGVLVLLPQLDDLPVQRGRAPGVVALQQPLVRRLLRRLRFVGRGR
jgi:hypothetical protein